MIDTITADDDLLDATFSALANPTRRAILARLAEGEASVKELAAPFEMSLPAVSRHLKVLQEAGLVRQGRRAQYRPCVIDPAPLAAAASWAEQYRPVWEGRLDRLEGYLADDRAAPDRGRRGRAGRPQADQDATGRPQSKGGPTGNRPTQEETDE